MYDYCLKCSEPWFSAARQAEIAKMEADIKRLARKKAGDDSEDDEDRANKKSKSGPTALEQERAKYLRKGPKSKLVDTGRSKKRDESDMLARLEKFKGKLRQQEPSQSDIAETDIADSRASPGPNDGDEGIDVDNDTDWMGHRLNFPKGNEEEIRRAEHDYEVIDPRTRSAAAREEEMERKRSRKSNVGNAFRRGR